MNSRSYEQNSFLAGDTALTLDQVVQWLEQSTISHYFDHYPSARRSFLEAVQRVAGRGSLVTPIATPAENDLDDEPAISDSREIANPTGSITHDDVDERVHGEASFLTNKFNTDIQRPQWNSPKSNETSRCLTVPVDSTIVDGTFSPFTNNEHIEKSLQTPVNEWVEQTGRDDQPYPNGPAAGGGHPEAGTLNLGGHTADEPLPCFCRADLNFDVAESSSHNNPTQVDTVPRAQAERKRKRKRPAGYVSIHQGQLASEVDTLSTLPRDILDKWNRIAGPEALIQLWHCLFAKRGSPSNKEPESTPETSDPLDTSIEGLLRRYQLQYQRGIKGTSKEYKQFAEVPWRLRPQPPFHP